MSYARFSVDSDVYVFLNVSGYFECCGCGLNSGHSEVFPNTDRLLEHLGEHEAAGHAVPASCHERLIERRDENDAWIKAENV